MKAFKMKNDEKRLYFTNYNREPEDIILKKVLKVLKQNKTFVINENIMGPSEDIMECTLEGNNFSLVYDIDYGPFIYSDDKSVIDKLIKFFK